MHCAKQIDEQALRREWSQMEMDNEIWNECKEQHEMIGVLDVM